MPAQVWRTAAQYLDYLFNNPYGVDVGIPVYMPNYSYFQGLVYSSTGMVVVAGPVRLIGMILTPDPQIGGILLQNGAMLTTNPDYLERITPVHNRFRVVEWKEVAP
ncbi:MAG: hypothetical protein HY319_19725 [Armatimonadetes bacterium]|nr:hypothetical protein [Armatimonadota bacterium]